MTADLERTRLLQEVREWNGTPYRHGGRIKQVGADCTFFAVAFENAELVPHIDIEPYSPQAHLHRAAGVYLRTILQYAREVDDPQPADIVMYFIGRDFSHGGVVVEPGWPHIVHADMEARRVIEARGDQARLAQAKRRVFLRLKIW